MSTIAETADRYLKAIFDTTDDIYKSLISNVDGIPEITITKPADYNIGAIASMLEWLRNLRIGLLEQLDLTTAGSEWLSYILGDILGIPALSGESDADWVTRVQRIALWPKISNGAIIKIGRLFSADEPEIITGDQDGMFSDVSFTDVYESFQIDSASEIDPDLWVFPAICTDGESGAFFFILLLTDTVASTIPLLFDYLERWVAAGIEYEVQIEYS